MDFGRTPSAREQRTFWLAIGDENAAELKVECQKIGFHCRSWVIWYYTFGVNCTRNFSRSHVHLFHFVKDPGDFVFQSHENRIPSARQLVYNDKRANPRGRLPDDTWIIPPANVLGELTCDDGSWLRITRLGHTSRPRPRESVASASSAAHELPRLAAAVPLMNRCTLGRCWSGFQQVRCLTAAMLVSRSRTSMLCAFPHVQAAGATWAPLGLVQSSVAAPSRFDDGFGGRPVSARCVGNPNVSEGRRAVHGSSSGR